MATDRRVRSRQLTLFPQPKPTDEHRWPRGYTPERRNEVRSALEETDGTTVYRNGAQVPASRLVSYRDENKGYRYTKRAYNPLKNRSRQREARAFDTIARSRTPASELTDLEIRVGAQDATDEILGDYHRKWPLSDDSARVRVADVPGEPGWTRQHEETLMHELGHHRSALEGHIGGRSIPQVRNADESVDQAVLRNAQAFGQEEARADMNVEERFVSHRKDPNQSPARESAYSAGPEAFGRAYGGQSFMMRKAEHQREAFEAYNVARGRPPQGNAPDPNAPGYRLLFDQDDPRRPPRYTQDEMFQPVDAAGFRISKSDEDPAMTGDRPLRYNDDNEQVQGRLGDPDLDTQGPMDPWRKVDHYIVPDLSVNAAEDNGAWFSRATVGVTPTKGRGRRSGNVPVENLRGNGLA